MRNFWRIMVSYFLSRKITHHGCTQVNMVNKRKNNSYQTLSRGSFLMNYTGTICSHSEREEKIKKKEANYFFELLKNKKHENFGITKISLKNSAKISRNLKNKFRNKNFENCKKKIRNKIFENCKKKLKFRKFFNLKMQK